LSNHPREAVSVSDIPALATVKDTSVEADLVIQSDTAFSSTTKFFNTNQGDVDSLDNVKVAESIVNHDNGAVETGVGVGVWTGVGVGVFTGVGVGVSSTISAVCSP
jgi:hypothetical protein